MKKITLFFSFVLLALLGFQANAECWALGDLGQGWDPSKGTQLTATGTDTYEGEFPVTAGQKWYGFTTKLGSNSNDWSTIADSRIGSTNGSNDLTVPVGTLTTVGRDSNKSLTTTFEAGTYKITVNTATPSVLITKVEGSQAEVTYTVAGVEALLGEEWSVTATQNDMTKQADGTYLLVKENVELAAGRYEYKVAVNHAWAESYPTNNASLAIAEAGKYNVTFTFNPTDQAVSATAEKVGDAETEIGQFTTLTIVGELPDAYWDPQATQYDMVKQADGTYKLIIENWKLNAGAKEYKMVADRNWDHVKSTPNNLSFSVNERAVYTVTFTFDGDDLQTVTATAVKTADWAHTAKLHHGLAAGGWADSEDIEATDGKVIFADIVVNEGDKFGFTIDGAWQTSDSDEAENYNIHSGWCTDIPLPNKDIRYFYFSEGGTLTITVENVGVNDTKFSVTGWAEPEPALTLHYGVGNDWTDANFEKSENDGKWYLNDLALEANTEFVFFDQNNTYYKGDTQGNEGNYEIKSDWCTDVPMSTEGANFQIADAGTYSFVVDLENKTFSVTGWAEPEPELYIFGNIHGNDWTADWEKGYKLTQAEGDPTEHYILYFNVDDVSNGLGYFKFGTAAQFSDETAIGAEGNDNFVVTSREQMSPIQLTGKGAIALSKGYYAMHVRKGDNYFIELDPQQVPPTQIRLLDENGEEVGESIELEAGKSVTLTAEIVAPAYVTDNAKAITWASSDADIVTVTEGTITAVKQQSIVIRRAPADGVQTASVTAASQVNPDAAATVTVNVNQPTGINDIAAGNIASIKYVNTMGQVSDRAFDGVNIIVTTFTDGTTTTLKVVK